ncbi:MAG: translation initiation factor IF-2 [bacterium]|jgi:translation initiation factor IF-2|nr:translation initiation factor IF-2 [bacterium]MDD4557485.1 translation initiation factor IF-2 [bacterium]
MKVRVYELAKKVNLSNKDLLDILHDLGIQAVNHSSSIDESEAQLVREYLEEERKNSDEGGELPPNFVRVDDKITIKNLAVAMEIDPVEILKKLLVLGVAANENQAVDQRVAAHLAAQFDFIAGGEEMIPKAREAYQVKLAEKAAAEEKTAVSARVGADNVQAGEGRAVVHTEDEIKSEIDKISEGIQVGPAEERPPIVTIMGHVDHGKTSLLDAIRKTNVTESESGGITQHIGAYQVILSGKRITFLDTPGHEAFTSMRARGAQVTDIAVLVVAADDGLMPQSIEAIDHARAAGVPIVVAINKIDRPDANTERVRQQLAEHNLLPEDWGGDTICVEVSALKKMGIDNLLEMILLVAEMAELKAWPKGQVMGTVVEASMDKSKGALATVLISNGTLRVGDNIIVGTVSGKVRAMINDRGERVKAAGPAMPVEIFGLSEVPQAGDELNVVEDERIARQIAAGRQIRDREKKLAQGQRMSLDDLFKQVQEGVTHTLNIILKADVQGTVEAVRQSLENLATDEVTVNIIHEGVGGISESDVTLATASNAIVVGFNVKPDGKAAKAAQTENIDLRLYKVIYELLDNVNAAINGMLEPEQHEVMLGTAEVRAIFKTPKGIVAGSYVLDGKVVRGARVRLIRSDEVVFEGRINTLRRFKEDVREVTAGYECGIGLDGNNDIQEGDRMIAFTIEETARAV